MSSGCCTKKFVSQFAIAAIVDPNAAIAVIMMTTRA
jgi:hypothetical protein